MSGELFYAWNGQPVKCYVYDDDQEVDVSGMLTSHPTGIVPADETHVFVWPADGKQVQGWWATVEKFGKYTDPIGPGAIRRETGDDVMDGSDE